MDKVKRKEGESDNIISENIERMRELFPDAFTEAGVNFETLRQLLGDESVLDEGQEKYGLNWHGKKKARQIALTPSTGTLLPCPDESVDWDTTKNLFIEGDNLEVLKLLQKSYANKVKMIYIDPPYNTGKEFIYPDRFQDNLDTYLQYTGQVDDEGAKFSSNPESSGRKHTNWLNMMYPRIKLARQLLSSDGLIFMSIDDNEQANLKNMCDDVFGEENFIGLFVINSSPSAIDYGHIAKQHDYALMYAKNFGHATSYPIEDEDKTFKYKDAKGDFNIYPLYNGNVAFNPKTRPNLYYPFYLNPNNKLDDDFFEIGLEKQEGCTEVYPVVSKKDGIQRVWRWGKPKSKGELNKEIVGYQSGSGEYRIVQKSRLTGKVIRSMQLEKGVSSRRGTSEVESLFGSKVFNFPKPLELMRNFIECSAKDDHIVLDLFAGSSTFAHAVFEHNARGGSRLRFISIQLPEPILEGEVAFEQGYNNISTLSRDRIRRAAKAISNAVGQHNHDFGFKCFKLKSSNIRSWHPDRTDIEESLISHEEHLTAGRDEQDVLYELLLKRGVDLAVPIESREVSGKNIYSIGYGALFACLDESITKEQVEDIAQGIITWHLELEPSSDTHVFFRDSAFQDDVSKTNMAAILEQNGIMHVRSL